MRKAFVLLVTLILASFIFAAGSVSLIMNPNASWSQTLTFSVRQWIKVTWDYDETQAFAIDDTSYTVTVGNIEFRSNKKFKFYYGIGSTLPTGVSVVSVKVGSTVLSNSSTTPTEVSTKLLSGILEVGFNPEVLNVENDFSVKFDFTFLPF
ncbi:hypothetical protein QQE94_07595 [Fervidobacterium pennivorans subsp. shakshaketiis]|uniref:hypothetical protein n=1 Tax=Fervidobacterium pennivorans TaxID=93466 RepID=UPI0014369AE9|nr:hypothetical protein [Fervidobacterium pennivorans]QIV78710.1 hypothetical protein HER11_07070 [Fervidobacterium pennivorans subsp. keratinolyticus]